MIGTVCLITSRLTAEARDARSAELLRLLSREYPDARAVVLDDSLYPAAEGESEAKRVPGADPAFVRGGVRLSLDDLPEKYQRHVTVLQMRQVANARKHMDALRIVAESGGTGLVLEDDALPGQAWADALRSAARCVADADGSSPGGCLSFLGLSARDAPPGQPVPVGDLFEVAPVCDSYLVGPRAAMCMSSGFLPLRFRTNVHLSYLADTLGVRAVLFRSNAFCDGSKVGVYASTLNVNNRLLLSADYMKARNLLESMQRTGDAREKRAAAEEAKRIVTQSALKSNSDMMFLRAVCESELAGPRAGRVAFAAAYAAAVQAGALINNESELLNSMIGLYSDVGSQAIPGRVGPGFDPAFSDPRRRRARHLNRREAPEPAAAPA